MVVGLWKDIVVLCEFNELVGFRVKELEEMLFVKEIEF